MSQIDNIAVDAPPIITKPDAVLSCPGCLRQYKVNPDMDGKAAQCSTCCHRFGIALPQAANGDETPLVLDNPMTAWVNFLAEACDTLMRNIIEMLKLSNEPVTKEAIIEFAKSIPQDRSEARLDDWRRRRCSRTMEKGFNLTRETPEQGRFDALFEYFLRYIPDRHLHARTMMIDAVCGVLGGLKLDEPKPEAAREPKRRWWRR